MGIIARLFVACVQSYFVRLEFKVRQTIHYSSVYWFMLSIERFSICDCIFALWRMVLALSRYISPAMLHAVYGGGRVLMIEISLGVAVNIRVARSLVILVGGTQF